jgi:hypothetical protein
MAVGASFQIAFYFITFILDLINMSETYTITEVQNQNPEAIQISFNYNDRTEDCSLDVELDEMKYQNDLKEHRKDRIRKKRSMKLSPKPRLVKRRAVEYLTNDRRKELAEEIKKKARQYKVVRINILLLFPT